MAKPRKQAGRRKATAGVGNLAGRDPAALRSYTVGALPILNHFLDRMKLEEILQAYLPAEDRRRKVPAARGLVRWVKNILISREPTYGLGEWATRYAPDLLGLEPEQVLAINDDRAGRWLGRFFACGPTSPALAAAAHSVEEFAVSLDELHNDSTTVSFHGAYPEAAEEKRRQGRNTLAITFGHNKDYRPDLKQLLYILTLSENGGVPVHFRAASGNVVDDHTHRDTWQMLCRLAGRPDFLYVADCKLATTENMTYIHGHGGRFVSVLPRTRKEDAEFRRGLLAQQATWRAVWDQTDEQGKLVDRFSVSDEPALTAEGYRLVWLHSTRKAERDAAARVTNLQRALKELGQLRAKLHSPRTRYRQQAKVDRCGQGDPGSLRGLGVDSGGRGSAGHRDVPASASRSARQTHPLPQKGNYAVRPERIDRPPEDRHGDAERWSLPPGDQRSYALGVGTFTRLQASAAGGEAFRPVEDRLPGGPGLAERRGPDRGVVGRLLLCPVGPGVAGARATQGDGAGRDRGVADVSRGPPLPPSHSPPTDRPV